MSKKAIAACITLVVGLYSLSTAVFLSQQTFAQNVVNEFLNVVPDIAGIGINKFFPETLVVNQGDTVNISIRNLVNQTYSFAIENTTTSTINPALSASNGSLTPIDSLVPPFAASQVGIFPFQTSQDPNLAGYIVVLPTDWNSYSPSPTERDITMISIPDFAGDMYDKFFPNYFIVNQYDNVNLTIENADTAYHGFALAAQNISVILPPGNATQNGPVIPSTTNIPRFNASSPGNFQFECIVYCGPGHFQMTGVMTVLPTMSANYSPTSVTAYEFLVVKQDFTGPGYSTFIPPIMVVNQNDLVYIVARNTANVSLSLSIPVFSINYTLAPANASGPTDTYLAPFFASQAGIYEYSPSNIGDSQMIGYLVVLPRLQGIVPTGPALNINIFLIVIAAILLLVAGFIGGLVTATHLDTEQLQDSKESEISSKVD